MHHKKNGKALGIEMGEFDLGWKIKRGQYLCASVNLACDRFFEDRKIRGLMASAWKGFYFGGKVKPKGIQGRDI